MDWLRKAERAPPMRLPDRRGQLRKMVRDECCLEGNPAPIDLQASLMETQSVGLANYLAGANDRESLLSSTRKAFLWRSDHRSQRRAPLSAQSTGECVGRDRPSAAATSHGCEAVPRNRSGSAAGGRSSPDEHEHSVL